MSSTVSRESMAAAGDAHSSTSESTSNGATSSSGGVAGNAFAAQLANLYSANQSLSPFARHTEHSMFRSLPKRKQTVQPHDRDEHGLSRTNSSLMSIPSGTIITPAVSPTSSSGPGMSGIGYVTPRMVARRSRKAVRRRVFTLDLRPKPVQDADIKGARDSDDADVDEDVSPSSSVSVVGAYVAADEDWAARFTDELLPSSSVSEVGVEATRAPSGGLKEAKSQRRRVSNQ
ncbi:hypothetical protein BCR44DRAFT_1058114 [Catenaria anguillulae PL171]|uniref:Uncharacterized protein n=1 Tax=Catenaria anguillulae PL171 TaxID=765915 RepID=A0A1Y2HQ13_9FUNG|nr:hypothetical protein BCR44DRAFT_1058114 [Catenaria anguillulae PL171]